MKSYHMDRKTKENDENNDPIVKPEKKPTHPYI